ncbi:coiled-coil domain-containing protein [Spelaeicoccus albus]|uniref:Septal ring factor EnvC (AmiA/AmiB activator) n=1 Tax=Spelaeicoccus albus TaxID=1280376 RepID=A0A7Z0D306_9MICO|nr:transglycosylase [Spelaeicoccus albus]NYI67883.1 septal ring factor EnvC (AmiA/AmiB activator) [Spelaeicoccus albus]
MLFRRSRAHRVLAIALGVVLGTGLLTAPAAAKSKYPTWSDVKHAREHVSETKSEIGTITKLLHHVQAKAAKLGDEAVEKGAEYDTARSRLDAATAKMERLKDKLKQTERDQAAMQKKVSRVAVQSYKNGGSTPSPSMALMLNPSRANSMLDARSDLGLLSSRNSKLLARAEQAKKSTESLTAQAKVAAGERKKLSDAAHRAFEAAQAAKAAADHEVAKAKKRSKTLVAQLATLKHRSVKVEKRYQDGVAARKAYRAQQAAARRAAERAAARRAQQASSSSSGSTSTPSYGGGSPSTARAYARSRLAAYGWSSSQYGCLLNLWNQESDWDTYAVNPSSHAYGIPQSLPASKMASAGSDWRTNYRTQVNWGLGYIRASYGSPCGAWSHEVSHNWY